jgi:hypothetical protein
MKQKDLKYNSLLITILILFAMIKLSKPSKKRSDSDIQCISQNTYWESIISKEDFIKDPTTCHNISDDCCYINIKYTYNIIPFEKSYCFTMSGNVDSWIKKFTNLFRDELMWYANKTYHNFEEYKLIGNNLDYVYYANYYCMTPHPIEDYSTYDISRCALFNDDRTCAIFNDVENFDAFVENLYRNITLGMCSGIDRNGYCINYAKPDYKSENSSELIPLLETLKSSLKFEEEEVTSENQVAENVDNNNDALTESKWDKPCEPIPLVTVTVKCPDAYSISSYFKLNYFMLYVALIFLI